MIDVDQALSLVLQRARAKRPVRRAVEDALHLVLAEDVVSDVDSPPHDKAMVDGYAVVARDLASGSARLRIVEEITAGQVPTQKVTAGTATQIMTGAPLPPGADAVVMVERTTRVECDGAAAGDAACVEIREQGIHAGVNIMPRGTSLSRGDVVLSIGSLLRPIEIGLLSEVGRTEVDVFPPPQVAILSTGNELVPADVVPGPGHIRNSNGPMLRALVQSVHAEPVDLGIGPDDAGELKRLMAQGLESDVLVLSGGVSAGVLDLVPSVLADLGVQEVFHQVKLKPGKPLWFGVHSRPERQTLVFGLPGNPVSSLVCFELFVRPAIGNLAGRPGDGLAVRRARLAREHVHRGDRPTYFPAVLCDVAESALVDPVRWRGSADLRSLIRANCLAYFPAGDHTYAADEWVDVYVF